MDSDAAFKLIQCSSHSWALLGFAGTGKSFALRKFRNDCERNGVKVAVLAPTNEAAHNVDGLTFEKFMTMPPVRDYDHLLVICWCLLLFAKGHAGTPQQVAFEGVGVRCLPH